jgi:hypothetical protein
MSSRFSLSYLFLNLLGGVECGTLPRPTIWRVCHLSRVAQGVRVRATSPIRARGFGELERALDRLGGLRPLLAPYLAPTVLPEIQVSCSRSRLFHSGAVQQRLRSRLGRELGVAVTEEKKPEKPVNQEGNEGQQPPSAPVLHVRIAEDMVQVSCQCPSVLLTLHLRLAAISRGGWGGLLPKGTSPGHSECTVARGAQSSVRNVRLMAVFSPQTYAAACLLAAGYAPGTPLFDPFCGSGTVAA